LFAQAPSLDRAWKLVRTGHRDQAITILADLVRRNPDDADARLLLGSLYTEKGNRDNAIDQLTATVQLRPNSAEAQNALGEAYSSFEDFASARQPLEQAVALNPKLAIAQVNLARVLIHDLEYPKAAAYLDKALSVLGQNPDAATAHYLRAKIYIAQTDTKQAAKELDKAVAILPAFAAAWSDLGEARKTLLDHAGALVAFRRAVKLSADDSVAQYRLGEEYLTQHQPHLAVEPLTQAHWLTPQDHSILNALQKALRQDGQIAQADQVKQELAALLNQDEIEGENEMKAVKLNNEGARLQSAGDLRAALAKYSAAAALSPRDVPIHVNYAVAMLRLGQWTDGLNELHQSLLMDPNNEKIRAALRDALAQAPAESVPQWKNELK
jgi:tetratricopeptide (TPR) repeat protein